MIYDAIDACHTALSAVDWVATTQLPVTVVSGPVTRWDVDQLSETFVLQLLPGSVLYERINRDTNLAEQVAVGLVIAGYVGPDEQGSPDYAALKRMETLAAECIKAIRTTFRTHASLRLLQVERPEIFDEELLKQGIFITGLDFTIANEELL